MTIMYEAGYTPGLLGRVATMHAQYYAREYGFGAVFERKVATEMAEFLGRLKSPNCAVFSAHLDGQIIGSVSIDGEDLGDNTAHLRWLILSERLRGKA